MKDVAGAIAYAHSEGVIHRDLKPGNILIDKDGTPRVTDFGLAKRVEGEASGLTVTGQVLGTPSYMPPEQARGDSANITQLADVYSLGAVLYCLVTGRPPFQAASPVETLVQVTTREPLSPRQLNPAVPLDLETIILKCLEKEPSRRYASAQHLGDELVRFLEAGAERRVQPRGHADRLGEHRSDRATLGRGDRSAALETEGTHQSRRERRLQPRQHADRLDELRSHGQDLGRDPRS
jgi:serine/threonine protein kinase